MIEFHKELLVELVKDWTPEQLSNYICELEIRATELDRWIKHVKTIRRKKVRKSVFDTGERGGKG